MRKFLFATHGALAAGLKSSLDILAGSRDDITTICAYGEFGDPDSIILEYFQNVDLEDEVYVLTDISFGSISQKIIPYLNANIHLIAGVNLPLALQLIMYQNEIDIKLLIEESRQSIIYMNDYLQRTKLSSEDE